MKKAVLLIAVMLLLLLCSCGADVGKETETTLIYANTTGALETRAQVFYTKNVRIDPSDPYSVIIKERCEEFRKIWKTDDDFKGFSAESFDKYIKYYPDVYYSLNDLNGDGVEELLLGGWEKTGVYTESPTPPRKLVITSVYAVKNGEAVKMNSRSWWNMDFIWDRVLLTNGMILTTWGKKEDPNYSFLSYEAGELKLNCAAYLFDGDTYATVTGMNGKEVMIDHAKFESLRDESIGDATPVEIEWKRIDEYGQ